MKAALLIWTIGLLSFSDIGIGQTIIFQGFNTKPSLQPGKESIGAKTGLFIDGSLYGATLGFVGYYERALLNQVAIGGDVTFWTADVETYHYGFETSSYQLSDLAGSVYGKYYWNFQDTTYGSYVIAGLSLHALMSNQDAYFDSGLMLGLDWGIGGDLKLGNGMLLNGEIRVREVGALDHIALVVGASKFL